MRMGLLNISLPWQIQAQEEPAIISWRECSKLVLRVLEGKSVQSSSEHKVEGKVTVIVADVPQGEMA